MEDRETARMRKYGESKMTRIMMATVPHVTSGLGLRKFQADGFLLTRVYIPNVSNGQTFHGPLIQPHTEQKAGCSPRMVWTMWRTENPLHCDLHYPAHAQITTLSYLGTDSW